MTTSLQITDLNLASIENSIKEFLKDTPEFSGYNFEGSVMSRIVKILAYNTYHQAYLTNMIGNESYLDTALIRQNIVSRAKAIGYTPRSMTAATASLTLTFLPDDSPDSIFIPKYTAFRSTLDGVIYNFLTLQDNYVQNFSGSYIKTISVYEGQSYTYNYTYDSDQVVYEIPDPKVDTSKLKVYIKENSATSDRTEYKLVDDITEINSESDVYFLQENSKGNYEIYFGDGILGKELETGNIVQIEALICNGPLANDIGAFTAVGYSGYNKSNYAITYGATISANGRSSEGQDRETETSIKFSAPKNYEMQKRSVVEDDYKNYLMSKYSDIQSISVWGGEKNDPPIYGKVIISIKPSSGYVISNYRKSQIIADLKGRNVQSIDPLIIDPIFTYVNIRSDVEYNSTLTSKTKEELFGDISETIIDFESETLSKFQNSFRFSKLSTAIDATDTSISSNNTEILYEKRFTPIYDTTITYKLQFNIPLYNPYDGYLGCLTSTQFKLANTGANFCYLDDDGLGNVRIYYLQNNDKVYVNRTAGTIDYDTGKILLTSFRFTDLATSQTEFRIFVQGNSSTYTPIRNEILLLSFPVIQLFDIIQNTVVFSSTIDVLGNTSPLQTNAVLTSVVI
jgi:hypothetical protein